MVNRKAAIIASSVVAVLIAAGVVLAVIFTVVLPNKSEGPEVSSFAAPNPGMKVMISSGNVNTNNWLMTYRAGVDVEAVRREMENANMPWNITAVDAANNQVMMQCEPNMVSAAASMKTNALVGAYVEQDVVWTTNAPTTIWGLDRTDQRNLPLNNDYSSGGYDGSTVDVHVLDTGVDASHPDIAGRVQAGYDGVQDGRAPTTDCQGHGTHVSGTIGGSTYGLAKGTTIYASRVLGCDGSGSTLGIGNAIEWVANLPAGRKRVINMSLGGGASQYLDQKVAYAVSKGVTVVVAAGNENQNACNVSPAREPTAITVAASDRNDAKASFSNWGPCTDIVAPGVAITSARPTNLGGGATGMSGTSMASPHVAGVAALVLHAYPDYSPAQVASHLVDNATPNVVQGLTGNYAQTPNRLLFWSAPAPATSTSTSTSEATPTTETPTTSEPTPETSAPTPGDITETGNLPIGGVIQFPIGGYLTVTKAGPISAKLVGAPGTDFDLYLWRYVNGQWAIAERAETASSSESMVYNNVDATTQYFIFQVASFTGEGPFALSYTDPQV